MKDDPSKPFGHNTLDFSAVFVPETDDSATLTRSARSRFGFDCVVVNAVVVPEGAEATKPSYPFVPIGQLTQVSIANSGNVQASQTVSGAGIPSRGHPQGE